MKMKKVLVGIVGVGFILGSTVASAFFNRTTRHYHYHIHPKPISKTWVHKGAHSSQDGGFHAGGSAKIGGTSVTTNKSSKTGSRTHSSMTGQSGSGYNRSHTSKYGTSKSSGYTYFNGHKQQTAQRMASRKSSTNVSTFHGSAKGHMASWYKNKANQYTHITKHKY